MTDERMNGDWWRSYWMSLAFWSVLAGAVLLVLGSWAASEGVASEGAGARPEVVVLTTDFVLAGKFDTVGAAARTAGVGLEVLNLDRMDPAALDGALAGRRLALLDAPRESDAQRIREAARAVLDERGLPWLLVTARGPESSGLEAGQAGRLHDYYRQGGVANFQHFFRYLRAAVWGEGGDGVPPPSILPERGIYHPEHPARVVADLASYLDWLGPDRARTPRIGLAFHQSAIGNALTDAVDDLIQRIEAAGAVPVAFYHPVMSEGGDLDLLMPDGRPGVDVLINAQVMYQGDRREDYARLGVPVLQAIAWRGGDGAHWAASAEGIPMGGVPFYLAIPEQAGMSDPLVVSAVSEGRPVALPEQAQALVDKALRLARLRVLPNAEKRVVVMFYNYPPGERNISASFLNVPRSLAALSQALAGAGYALEPLDEEHWIERGTALLAAFYRPERLSDLIERDLAGLLPLEEYEAWLATQPAAVRERIAARWGEPDADPMVVTRDGRRYFVVPRIQLGHLLALPQPPRGQAGEPAEKGIYHDTKVPLNHAYLASYLYVRQSFGADALIHLGTHGTQEWTPGKERGLSMHDDPYLVLGDLPVIYPYIVDNIGEATQAKRRGRAVTVSHQTPAFSPAGLRQDVIRLHDLIHEHGLLDEGEVRHQTEVAIIAEAVGLNLMEDLGWTRERASVDFGVFLPELHDYLHELARLAQPLGLHALGEAPPPGQRLTTVMQMLGDAFYGRLGLDDPDELFVEDHARLRETQPYRFLERHLIQGEPLDDPDLAPLVEQARGYFADLEAREELTAVLAVLDGRYLETRSGGDPIRSPDSLPTGRNLYGFDPSKVPTRQAFEAGEQALATLVETHRQSQGGPPEKLAFSLWSVETMRHLGVLESQVFQALGVRPVWDRAGRVTDVEVIPRAELGRPRIDVVVSATGLYRDHFPMIMNLIAQAVARVAELDEPDNTVRANTLALERRFRDQGMAPEQARELALTRVFSSQSGTYGTNLDEATLASDTWEDEGKLAELYLARMQYAYGPDPKRWGGKPEGLNLYAEQLKGVDGAVLSRSSNLYGMLTTDDPFQYLGGLGLAVRHLTGRGPQLYISNLRDRANQGRIDSAARFLAGELRSRYFHPQWIQAMQAEGYAGTLTLVDTLNNFWGWQAAAPEIVRDDQWQGFFEVYVEDSLDLGLREWLEEHNPQALAQMVERMLEAARKEYWKADADTLQTLTQVYLDAVERHGYQAASSKLDPYARQLAAGFGLEGAAPPEVEAAAGTPQPVSGPLLEPIAPAPTPSAVDPATWLLLPLLAIGVLGALRQWRAAGPVSRLSPQP